MRMEDGDGGELAENEEKLAIHVDCQLLFACDSLLHMSNPGGSPYAAAFALIRSMTLFTFAQTERSVKISTTLP